MRVPRPWMHAAAGAVLSLAAFAAAAADYPAPKEGAFVANDFRFHTGEVLPEVRLHYRTIGEPSGEPVVVLHGTGGSGVSMLTPAFAGELFGEGRPLDAKRHFIILPDAIGHGKSAKPSDGLKAKFPKYNAEDMVDGQHRLLTEGLGLRHAAPDPRERGHARPRHDGHGEVLREGAAGVPAVGATARAELRLARLVREGATERLADAA